MTQFRFRALVTLESSARGSAGRAYASGTRALMVRARRIGQPSCEKYFPAEICHDQGQPLRPGDHAVVTITVTEADALGYLAPGQPFTIWGGGFGHGVISRRVFTNSGPS